MGYDENSIQVAANYSGSARRRERRGHFRAETNRQNGSCVDTDKDGDNVFITFDDKNLYYSGGTGKYKGITGTAAYTYVELHETVGGRPQVRILPGSPKHADF